MESDSLLNFDLAAYGQRYRGGYSKVPRLCFIGEKCPQLAASAANMALKELKNGLNTEDYCRIFERYSSILQAEGQEMDVAWITEATRKSQDILDRLESELSAVKTSGVKDSIRMSYNDIGHLYYRRGQFAEAVKHFMKTKEYCTLQRHVCEMCVNIIRVYVESGDVRSAQIYVNKLESLSDVDVSSRDVRNVTAALLQLQHGSYFRCAQAFLQVESSEISNFPVSVEDVATYTSLCLMATVDRQTVRNALLNSQKFKKYFELVPNVRVLVQCFADNRFGECITALNNLKKEFALDLYLSPHVGPLCDLITEKLVANYCVPFQAICLKKMVAAFSDAVSLDQLERIFAFLISKGVLCARIDSQAKVVHKRSSDARPDAVQSVLNVAKEHQQDMKRSILHLSLLEQGFIVKATDEGLVQQQQQDKQDKQQRTGGGTWGASGSAVTIGMLTGAGADTGPRSPMAGDDTDDDDV